MSKKKKLSAGKAHEKARLAALKATKKSMNTVFQDTTSQLENTLKKVTGRNAVAKLKAKIEGGIYGQDINTLKKVLEENKRLAAENERQAARIRELEAREAERQKQEEERNRKLEILHNCLTETDWNNADPEDVIKYDSSRDWIRSETGENPDEFTNNEILNYEPKNGEELF